MCLRCSAALFSKKEIMRTDERHRLQEVRDGSKALVAAAFVVELAPAQELNLWSVKGVAINLPMVELDGAVRLLGRE